MVTGATTSFGAILRAHRAWANLTQEELAERSGMSVQAISSLERGVRRAPRTSTVVFLAEALRLDAVRRDALLAAAHGGSDEPAPLAPAGLPRAIRDFTGRAAEVALVREAVEPVDPTAPAVAVIAGMAGAGKTALALHVAHLVRDRFPDGQLFADLGGAEGRPVPYGKVLTGFLLALGLDDTAIPPDPEVRLALFRARLAGRRLLFVLDNAGDESQVRPLLPNAPGSAALVTGRGPLSGLEGAVHLQLGVLSSPEALYLLGRVAGRRRVDDEPEAAADIVQLVGRLPLAIRVAGARLASRPVWSLRSYAARLADERRRLDELRAGDLEVRASLALSYQALDEDARRCFRLLGVLDAADFPSWMAAALFDRPVYWTEALLERLVDAGLLETLGEDVAGQLRYRLQSLLRLYAGELLAAEDGAEAGRAALERALGGLLMLAERAQRALSPAAAREIVSGSAARWCPPESRVVEAVERDPLAWFDAERPDLVASVLQAGRADLHEVAWELAASMSIFLTIRGHWQDAYAVHDEALRVTSAAGDRRGELQAALLVAGARLWLFDVAGAEASAQRAVCLARELGDRRQEGLAHGGLAMAALYAGDLDAALDRSERSIALLRASGARHGEAVTLYVQAQAMRGLGRLDEAGETMRTSNAIFAGEGERLMVGVANMGLADVLADSGRHAESERCLTRALEVFEELDSRLLTAVARYRLVAMRLEQRPRQEAVALLEECLRSFQVLGLHQYEAAALDRLERLRAALP